MRSVWLERIGRCLTPDRSWRGGEGRPDRIFEGQRGHYIFLLDIPEDQRWLDFYEPRIVIYEWGGRASSEGIPMAVGELFVLALFLGVPAGVCMLVLAAMHRRQEEFAAFLKAHPLRPARRG